MRITGSASPRNVGGKIKGAADTILGTGTDTADVVCDTRSGALLTFILLFVVGWIPTIGHMVAGYVGGRRSGSPYRGLLATSVATACVLVILTLIALFLDSVNGALSADYQAAIDSIREQSPLLADLAVPTLEYLRAMFGGDGLKIAYASYAITPVFGIIGGVISNQMQKELRYIIRVSGGASSQQIRSMERHRQGKPMGFNYSQVTALSTEPSVRAPAPQATAEVIKTPDNVKAKVQTPKVVDTTVDAQPEMASSTSVQKSNPFDSILSLQKKKMEPVETANTSTLDDDQYL